MKFTVRQVFDTENKCGFDFILELRIHPLQALKVSDQNTYHQLCVESQAKPVGRFKYHPAHELIHQLSTLADKLRP